MAQQPQPTPHWNQERSDWRDKAISDRHRTWGDPCHMEDFDFIVMEYNYGEAKAFVEYKAYTNHVINVRENKYQAMAKVATTCKLPFFVVQYDRRHWYFVVTPANDIATRYYRAKTTLSEVEYVDLLYRLRGITLSPGIKNRLNRWKPGV